MTNILENTREFLRLKNLDYLLINSTNDFLVEYNELSENSRYFITGFTGSTGDALLTMGKLYLFVDGRYHVQADNETDKNVVTVVKLKTGQTFVEEFCKFIKPNSRLGIFSYKNSQAKFEKIQELLKDKNICFKLLDKDPIVKLNREPQVTSQKLDESLTGLSVDEKIKSILQDIPLGDGIIVTNLEEVSYVFNTRNFEKQFTSVIKAKAFISHEKVLLFTPDKMDVFENYIKNFQGKIYVDKTTINVHDYNLIKDKVSILGKNPIMKMKSVKTESELEHYKECFERTDKTLYAIRQFIEENDELSEYDIAQKLKEYFYKFGAKSLSFSPIVAIDENSALAHYSKNSKDVFLKDGGLVLIDCGAYYEGGLATDITRVFVKGKPTELQKRVYTVVLKMFLNSFNYNLVGATTGYDIDELARQIQDKNQIEGFDFNHGLGHGLGVSVHEYPPNLSKNELAKVRIQDNMCFTIEPGLYNKKHFGIRLENSCYCKYGVINSFSDMCYERKLIDFSLLSDQELKWLKLFKVL